MTEGKRTSEYKRISDRAAQGDFDLVVPFDFVILEHLPEVGTLFAGLFPLGETVANIQKTINKTVKEAKLPTGAVYGRIRSMEMQGLVSHTKGAKSSLVWQRTKKGTTVYREWKEKQGKERQSGTSTNA